MAILQKLTLAALLAGLATSAPSCLEVTNAGPQFEITAPVKTTSDKEDRVAIEFHVNNLADSKYSGDCYSYLDARDQEIRGTCVAPLKEPDNYGFWTGYFGIHLATGEIKVMQRWECDGALYNGSATAVLPKYQADAWKCMAKNKDEQECNLELAKPISLTATLGEV